MQWKRLLFYSKYDQAYFDIVAGESADLFFRQSISNTRALMLGAVLFAVTMIFYQVDQSLILSWLACQFALGSILTMIARTNLKATENEQALVRFMLIRMVLGNIIALLFGVSLFLLPEGALPFGLPVFLLLLLMICIITIFRYAMLPSYFCSINICIGLPIVVFLLLNINVQNAIYLVVIVGGINVIVYAGLKMAKTSRDVIVLNAKLRGEISGHIQTKEELESMALQDYLTGLGNRRLFEKMLVGAIAKAKRDERPVMVLYIDLDNFKPVNDEYGHEIGDKLLQAVATRIQSMVRVSDTVARIGGDEFTILIDSIDEQTDVESIVSKFDDALSIPYSIEGKHLVVTASVGLSMFPEDGQTWNELMRSADAKMYQAKLHHREHNK